MPVSVIEYVIFISYLSDIFFPCEWCVWYWKVLYFSNILYRYVCKSSLFELKRINNCFWSANNLTHAVQSCYNVLWIYSEYSSDKSRQKFQANAPFPTLTGEAWSPQGSQRPVRPLPGRRGRTWSRRRQAPVRPKGLGREGWGLHGGGHWERAAQVTDESEADVMLLQEIFGSRRKKKCLSERSSPAAQ